MNSQIYSQPLANCTVLSEDPALQGLLQITAPLPLSLAAAEQPARVLLVEDDLNVALALRVRLEHEGFEVVTARDSTQGLNIAVLRPPNLVLLDFMLPDHDGIWVADRLRNREETSTVPFAFLTASRQAQLQERCEALGAVGFLRKPFESEDLVDLVERAVFGAGPDSGPGLACGELD